MAGLERLEMTMHPERVLALSMALSPSIGAESPLSRLNEDILQKIARMASVQESEVLGTFTIATQEYNAWNNIAVPDHIPPTIFTLTPEPCDAEQDHKLLQEQEPELKHEQLVRILDNGNMIIHKVHWTATYNPARLVQQGFEPTAITISCKQERQHQKVITSTVAKKLTLLRETECSFDPPWYQMTFTCKQTIDRTVYTTTVRFRVSTSMAGNPDYGTLQHKLICAETGTPRKVEARTTRETL